MAHSDSVRFTSESAAQTEAVGAALLALLPEGSVVALYGNLAAGKTCLVRGMARAAHTQEPISSPTFVVVNEYRGDRALHHLDLYRLTDLSEIIDLGYEELFEPDEGITLIEWAQRAERLLPRHRVVVRLEHAGADRRTVTIENVGVLPEGWRDRVLEAAEAGGA